MNNDYTVTVTGEINPQAAQALMQSVNEFAYRNQTAAYAIVQKFCMDCGRQVPKDAEKLICAECAAGDEVIRAKSALGRHKSKKTAASQARMDAIVAKNSLAGGAK